MYIDGKWLMTDQVLEVRNPANGQLVDKVFLVGRNETKSAIESAKNAFPLWSGLTGEQRGAYLHRIVEKLEQKKNTLLKLLHEKWENPFIMPVTK